MFTERFPLARLLPVSALSVLLFGCAPAQVQTVVVAGTPVVITATPESEEAPVTNPMLGSGRLDGNGIPPEFFSDIHVRKAFNYCFDWDTFIADVFQGEAVQSFSVILPGMLGYDPSGKHYTYDPGTCEEELKQAWDGQAWEAGFRVQLAYAIGDSPSQTAAEILAENLNAINERFVIETLGLPWPAFLAAMDERRLPIFASGWIEDIHDPHNWVVPYLTGAYGHLLGMPDDLVAQFQESIDQGIAASTPAERQAIYYELNDLVHENAPHILLAVGTGRRYEARVIQGWSYNPIFGEPVDEYFYALSKAGGSDPSTYVKAISADAQTLDPALNYEFIGIHLLSNTYETLVYFNLQNPNEFKPQLASGWSISDDGRTYVFTIRQGIRFHEGGELTASDAAYSLQKGLLQGGSSSPQWLLAEPFFGIGIDDVSLLVDPEGNLYDDREGMQAADPTTLAGACERVKSAIVADDQAGTLTLNLAQAWGPMIATLALPWGSVLDQEWVIAQGGWDGSCDTWQDFYAMTPEEDPLNATINGTGPFRLDHWTPGEEIVLVRNEAYWRTEATGPLYDGGPTGPAALARIVYRIVQEWGTRFAMAQAGDVDNLEVATDVRPLMDPLVGEVCHYDASTGGFSCEEVGGGAWRMYRDHPAVFRIDIFFNFDVAQ
jgi:ABC-type transport system substrate-binding protein